MGQKSTALPVPKKDQPPYAHTEADKALIQKYLDKEAERRPVRLKVKAEGTRLEISTDHPSEPLGAIALMSAVGTSNVEFARAVVMQLANIVSNGGVVTETALNDAFTTFRGFSPRDETEALLAVQMVAVHRATITSSGHFNYAQSAQQQEQAINAFNKLKRTFTTQIESLKKYRSNGEQHVRVTHVHARDGGQVIVGDVNTGGAYAQKATQPNGPSCAYELGAQVLSQIEAVSTEVQSPGREGVECVPMSRRKRRRSER